MDRDRLFQLSYKTLQVRVASIQHSAYFCACLHCARKTRRSRTKRDNLILVGKRPIIPENNHWGWVDGSKSGSALL